MFLTFITHNIQNLYKSRNWNPFPPNNQKNTWIVTKTSEPWPSLYEFKILAQTQNQAT